MKRILFALIGILIGGPAWAGCSSYSYPLTSGTTAVGSQVYGNFSTVMNCVVSFSGGTTSGTATAQTLASVGPTFLPSTSGNTVVFTSNFTTIGATTLNIGSTGYLNVFKQSASGLVALGAGDMVMGQIYTVQTDGSEYVLLNPTPLASTAIVGLARNVSLSISAPLSSVTPTANEFVVETALGGTATKLVSYSQTLNVSTTGAGGMDVSPSPTSGFVAVYAIYGSSGTSILGCNVTESGCGNQVYGATNMPAGYTASGLLAILPTEGTKSLKPGYVLDREFNYQAYVNVFTAHATASTLTSQSISSCVPPTAVRVSGLIGTTSNATSNMGFAVAADSAGTGAQSFGFGASGVANLIDTSMLNGGFYARIPIITAQTIYWAGTGAASSMRLDCNRYEW